MSTTTGLAGFIKANNGTWGNDMNNMTVASAAGFSAAVAVLRSPAARNQATTAGGPAYSNPPLWGAFAAMMTQATPTKAEGASIQAQVQAVMAAGIEPLLVFCASPRAAAAPP